MSEDIVVTRYIADVSGLVAGLDKSQKKLGEQGAIIDQNGKKISALSNKFEKSGQVIGESIIKGSNGMKALATQTDKAEQELIQFGKATVDLTNKTETLRQRYKKAMLDVQNGVEGAAEKAGQLKDEMDDAAESVRNLATGSKLEAFGNQLGTVTGKLAALDFEGAAQAAKQLGDITSKISVKETLGQIKNLGSTVLNTLSSLINPSTLAIAALAGIGYAIYSLITAEDAEVKKLKELAVIQNERFKLDEVGYENEIELLKAAGKNFELVERKKLESKIKNTRINLELSQKVYELERENAIKGLTFVYGRERAEKMVRDKELGGENEKYNKKLELEVALSKAENALQVDKITQTKTFSDVLLAGVKVESEKRVAIEKKTGDDIVAQRKKWAEQAAAEELAASIPPIIKVSEERQRTAEEDFEIATMFDEKFQAAQVTDFEENLKRLEESLGFERGTYEAKQKMLDDALAQKKISEEQYAQESQELKDEEFQKDIQRAQKLFEASAFFVNALDSINSSIDQIQKNRLREGQELSKQQQQSQFNREKAFNIAMAAINGAQAVLKALSQFGPLGALLVGGQVASQIAAIATKEFQPLAEGTPLVSGGITGKDSVPAMLMPKERVVPVKDNMEHWDDLEAIRKGQYKKHIQMKYIAPALRDMQEQIRNNEGQTLAGNIASGLMLNGTWKGQNIERVLKSINNDEIKMHKELVSVIKGNKVSARKR